MVEEKGKLPIGVMQGGHRRRDFTLRSLKVRDGFDLQRSPDAKATDDDTEMRGLALLGRRLLIEGMEPPSLTLDQMLDLEDEDLAEILRAEGRLQEQLARFRTSDSPAKAAGDGAGVGRMASGTSDGDEHGGGTGVG